MDVMSIEIIDTMFLKFIKLVNYKNDAIVL